MSGGVSEGWPPLTARSVLDGLQEAVVATAESGRIVYVNPAAERLLEWPLGTLVGQDTSVLVSVGLRQWLSEGFAAFAAGRAIEFSSRPLEVASLKRDGSEIPTEVVMSVVEGTSIGRLVVASIRKRAERRGERWSELSRRLFETLAEPDSDTPAEERVLAVLGSHIGWEMTALWSLSADGRLEARHVWTNPEADMDGSLTEAGSSLSDGMEVLGSFVAGSGEPLFVPDLQADGRFEKIRESSAGLVSAVAFPVAAEKTIVGVVELFSTKRRDSELGIVSLVQAVRQPIGQLLQALGRAAERDRLVAELERARRVQEFLLMASRVLAAAADYSETLDRLAEVAASFLADLCMIDVFDESGNLVRMAARHNDPAKADLVRELQDSFSPDPGSDHPIVAVARGGGSRLSPEMPDEFLRSTTRNDRHYQLVKAVGFESYIVVPLVAGGSVLGSVTLVSAGSGRRFGGEDLEAAERLASQVASVVERARRHERDHVASLTLQLSLLPASMPKLPGLQLAARYQPADDYHRVGGDWYDAVDLGARVALVVGDIEGHDLHAAVDMGRLRHALTAILLEQPDPALALSRLGRLVAASRMERMATVLVGVLDLETGGLQLASAGHPAPILLEGGVARTIDVPVGRPVGSVEPAERLSTSIVLGHGCALLMFTDGLIEQRAVSWEEAYAHVGFLAESAGGLDAELIGDRLLSGMLPRIEGSDDVALLVAVR